MQNLVTAHTLTFRWINGQCFEFRFSNGKTLLTDPWYHLESGPLADKCPPGFTTEDLEGGDYVFLNHTHGDHIANLQEVCDRFHPTVIAHSAVCMELAHQFSLPLTSLYPVDYEGTYYFDGFILETHHGTHHQQPWDYAKMTGKASPFGGDRAELNAMGGIFNMNFVLTTREGMRIAFIGGNDDGMLQRIAGTSRPNLVIRNKMASSKVKTHVAEDFADWFAKADVPLLVPMHYETWLTDDPGFAAGMIRDMNRIMEEKGKIGRVAPMQRGKWYTLDLGISEL